MLPARQQGGHQEGSHLSLTWVVAPILFSLGNVSTGVANPYTPSPGFEPGTKRLTVARSTAELRRIVFFFLFLEVKTIVSFLHCVNSIHVLLKPHVFEVLISALHLTNKQEEVYCCYWSTIKLILTQGLPHNFQSNH